MNASIKDDLKHALFYLNRVQTELNADANIGLSADLLRPLIMLDEQYKDYCSRFDEEELGTTYHSEYGPNIEFYIEANAWHNVSLALRQWKTNNEKWPELLNIDPNDLIDD